MLKNESGLTKIKSTGVKIAVQDPDSAEVSYMPQQALDKVQPDLIVNEENLSKCLDLLEATHP
jgi:two-component system chemotaxis response regulator CheB